MDIVEKLRLIHDKHLPEAGEAADEIRRLELALRIKTEEHQCCTEDLLAVRKSEQNGWKEAAIAWEVCASIHEKWAKGKDALYSTRHADFERHAEDARQRHALLTPNAELSGPQRPARKEIDTMTTPIAAGLVDVTVVRLRCWWFGCEPHPQDPAPPDEVTCMHCGRNVPYGDLVGDTRHNMAKDWLRYWLWRRWWPAKCSACGARFGHRGDCDGIPF